MLIDEESLDSGDSNAEIKTDFCTKLFILVLLLSAQKDFKDFI